MKADMDRLAQAINRHRDVETAMDEHWACFAAADLIVRRAQAAVQTPANLMPL
jgi:hypothetical protein